MAKRVRGDSLLRVMNKKLGLDVSRIGEILEFLFTTLYSTESYHAVLN